MILAQYDSAPTCYSRTKAISSIIWKKIIIEIVWKLRAVSVKGFLEDATEDLQRVCKMMKLKIE